MEEQSKSAERILDQVADAVICANHSGTIIRWNHASTGLFGYSAAEALGQSIELIIPEHLRVAHWSGFDANRHIAELTVQLAHHRVIVKHALDTGQRSENGGVAA